MKLTHIMSNFFLNHMVSETAKTFGKSRFVLLFSLITRFFFKKK
jgi:hypothetical protein